MNGAIEDTALLHREDTGALTWRGPLLMLGARSAFAVVGAGARGGHLRPVYGTLIDVGCLTLLWRLTRREGIGFRSLINFDRSRLGRDVLVGLALIPAGITLILGGIYTTGWLVYGTRSAPYLFGQLPLPAALYGVFVFPVVWGLTEQMTSAHVLELPQKMKYTAEMYSAVNTTLYRYFAIIGGSYQIGSVRVGRRHDHRRAPVRDVPRGTGRYAPVDRGIRQLGHPGRAGEPRNRCCSGSVTASGPVAVAAIARPVGVRPRNGVRSAPRWFLCPRHLRCP